MILLLRRKRSMTREGTRSRPQINVFLYDMNDIPSYYKEYCYVARARFPSAAVVSVDGSIMYQVNAFSYERSYEDNLKKSNQHLCTAHATIERASERTTVCTFSAAASLRRPAAATTPA